MPLKLESFSRENDMLARDCDIYCECARGCDVSACDTGNKRIGSESARRETDRPVTDPGRSCEKCKMRQGFGWNMLVLSLTDAETLGSTKR